MRRGSLAVGRWKVNRGSMARFHCRADINLKFHPTLPVSFRNWGRGNEKKKTDAVVVANTHLVDNVDAVVELLSLQERVHVFEEDLEVILALSVGHDDGDVVSSAAVGRSPQSALLQLRVPGGERREGLCRLDFHRDPALCTPQDKTSIKSIRRHTVDKAW